MKPKEAVSQVAVEAEGSSKPSSYSEGSGEAKANSKHGSSDKAVAVEAEGSSKPSSYSKGSSKAKVNSKRGSNNKATAYLKPKEAASRVAILKEAVEAAKKQR